MDVVYARIFFFCLPLLFLLFLAALYFLRVDDISVSQIVCSSKMLLAAQPAADGGGGAAALPYSAALALVHYATSKITPQQTKDEMMVTVHILGRRGPCNFLVFGLGFDSPLWHSLNHGGRTVFLEENPEWMKSMGKEHPYLESYLATYTTVLTDADKLLAYAKRERQICSPDIADLAKSECKLALKTLPPQIYETKWDVIMIDAPTGYSPGNPGRMAAIFTAAVMALSKRKGLKESSSSTTDILLHDVDRPVERTYSDEFFCTNNLVEEVGKLRHYTIPGEATDSGGRTKSFCSRGRG